MALEGLDAAAALERGLLAVADLPRRRQLPHLDRLVQAAADELPCVGRECYAVHTIFVAVGALKALKQVSHLDVPHPDALVKRTSRDELGIGRDGNSRDPIFDGERQVAVTSLQIPDSDGPVAATRRNGASIAGEIERINILVVAREGRADLPCCDIPNLGPLARLQRDGIWPKWTHPDQFILGSGG